MWELLQKIENLWWKPYWKSIAELSETEKNVRLITSRNSWLWQFVCENHLYIYKMWENKNFIQDHFKNEYNECCYQYLYDKSCYEYYLLESALCDEEDLDKFLLDNIKI